jgi:hypothetical protein
MGGKKVTYNPPPAPAPQPTVIKEYVPAPAPAAPVINYTPPNVVTNYYAPPAPKQDDSFAKYLQYQMQQESSAQARADQERREREAKESARIAAGQAGYTGLVSTTQKQLQTGLLDYGTAQTQLRDYASKYNLSAETDINRLTEDYLTALPTKRATGVSAAYEELLGRQATTEEIGKAQERFTQGYYGSMEDFKDSLSKSQEYQKKFNQNYLDNYYDTTFGKQSVDEKGDRTGQRTFKFDPKLLPSYGGNLADRTKITTPDLGEGFKGTPAELEAQQQNIRDTRQYLYSAGLTNLQGEIDKETQSLKNEGTKQVAKIGAAGSLYSNLVSGFWG